MQVELQAQRLLARLALARSIVRLLACLERDHDANAGAPPRRPEERRHPGGVQALPLPPQLLLQAEVLLRVAVVGRDDQLLLGHRVHVHAP